MIIVLFFSGDVVVKGELSTNFDYQGVDILQIES